MEFEWGLRKGIQKELEKIIKSKDKICTPVKCCILLCTVSESNLLFLQGKKVKVETLSITRKMSQTKNDQLDKYWIKYIIVTRQMHLKCKNFNIIYKPKHLPGAKTKNIQPASVKEGNRNYNSRQLGFLGFQLI